MPFLLVDDGFDEHPKLEDLSDRAFRLHVSGLCYCARRLTDGLISEKAARGLCARLRAKKQHVSELVEAGLWVDYGPRGFIVHDYLEHNPTRDEVVEKREKRRAAGRLGGLRSGRVRANGEANASVLLELPVEPHPIPSHKDLSALRGGVVESVDNSLRSVTG